MKWLILFCILASVLLLLLPWRIAFASAARLPKIGDPAPDFLLQDQEGRARSLGDFRGRHVVLYFFPRADTPG